MRRPRFKRSRSQAGRLHEELDHERRRREQAEQLADTSLNVGEENLVRAHRLERLLRDLLERVDAHQNGADAAGAMRSGDLRLYMYAGRVRSELVRRNVPEPAESLNGHAPVLRPASISRQDATKDVPSDAWLYQALTSKADVQPMPEGYCVKCREKREITGAEEVKLKNGRPALRGTCVECGTRMFKLMSPNTPSH